MGDQGGGAPAALVEIAAARALQWNVDFERGLRAPKPGAQCEAVMKLGPNLVRWSRSDAVTASSAHLFKLEPGQDRVFANAILLRLAETFRSGNNFLRVCVLKVLLLELRGRYGVGEAFAADGFQMPSMAKSGKLTLGSGTKRRRRKARAAGDGGLLTTKMIEGHVETLRRIKSVVDGGDPVARALAIRVLGCLAELGKDSVDAHNIVLQAVHSPHHQEVNAALFAMGCFSEVSNEFAKHSLQTGYELVDAMETPPQVKVRAIRLFAKLGNSAELSLRALEMGKMLMLKHPIQDMVTTMLSSLTILATESSVVIKKQVDLLLLYIAYDPRMNVRAVALKCLCKLLRQAVCCMTSTDEIFKAVFAIVQDPELPSALHELALRIIRKLSHQCVAVMELKDLLQIISAVEVIALSDRWPVVYQALSLLVEMVCGLVKYRMKREASEHRMEVVNLSIRICCQLCDQVAICGAVAMRSRNAGLQHADGQTIPATLDEGNMRIPTNVKLLTICTLLTKLVEGCPSVGCQVVESVVRIMEALYLAAIKRGKDGDRGGEAESAMEIEESRADDSGGRQRSNSPIRSEHLEAKNFISGDVELILTELGRCLAVSSLALELKAETINDVYNQFRHLIEVLTSVECPPILLRPVLKSLMEIIIAHDFLLPMTDLEVGHGHKLGKLRDSDNRAGAGKTRLSVECRNVLQGVGRNLMDECIFWVCYQFGRDAACCAMWELARSIFGGLVDKVSSEGCYFWLRGLSSLAKAESLLQFGNSKDENNGGQGVEQRSDGSDRLDPDGDTYMDKGTSNPKDRRSAKGEVAHEAAHVGGGKRGRNARSAARAIGLLKISISSLSAGVCLERAFEFQRWTLTLRLKALECVSELAGLLAHLLSCNADAEMVDVESEGRNGDLKGLGSAIMASTEKIQFLAAQLKHLSEEYDLLSISFMGIDQESTRMLSRAALFCSLLMFCSVCVLPLQRTGSQSAGDSDLNVGAAALDLFSRVEQTDSEGWDDLLSFAVRSGAGVGSGRVFGQSLIVGAQEIALLNLARWAVTSVLGLQRQNYLLGVVQGIRLLQEIVQECENIPWLAPPFFFCMRPRAGVELVVVQAGATAGEVQDVSVRQGSAVALSVGLQVVNAPRDAILHRKKLLCALFIQSSEIIAKPDDDEAHLASKSDFVVNQPIKVSIIKKLVLHSKGGPSAPNFGSLWDDASLGGHSFLDKGLKSQDPAPDAIFSVSIDSKGQGFASCTLDTVRLPRGEYHLSCSPCICTESNVVQWVLQPSSPHPILRIT